MKFFYRYNYYDGSLLNGGVANINATLGPNGIGLHLRGGHIIPTQEASNNTVFSRKKPFGLIVALDNLGTAKGELFYDDGDSIDSIQYSKFFLSNFTFNQKKLKMNIFQNNYLEMSNLKLDVIRILGFNVAKDQNLNFKLTVSNSLRSNLINISNLIMNEHGEIKLINLNLKMNEEFEIDFNAAEVVENIYIDDERLRVDCYPEPNSNEAKCLSRKCVWSPSQIAGVPWCFVDKKR